MNFPAATALELAAAVRARRLTARALADATDITSFGSWRAYLASL